MTTTIDNKNKDVVPIKRKKHLPQLKSYTVLTYFLIITLSAVMRFIKIGFNDDNTPVFDEKHYSVQAMQLLLNNGVENNPGYGLIVHPPLGKFLISIGEKFFGYTPLGWRFMSIVAGVLIILLLCIMVHKITNSLLLVIFTGIISNTEGVLFGMSRMGMLDIFQALFITLIAFCLLFYITTDYKNTPWSQRWWLYGVGISSGLAMSIKISGIYYPAIIGVVLVFTTIFTTKSVKETLKSFFHGLFCLLVIPLTVFFITWIPWFRNETSWSFRAIEQGTEYYRLPEFLQSIVPDRLENWLSYQVDVMNFHTGLTTSEGNIHPWESKPWNWLYGDRPMLFLNDYPDTNNTNSLSIIVFIIGVIIYLCLIIGIIYGVIMNDKHKLLTKNKTITYSISLVSVIILSVIYGKLLSNFISNINDLNNSDDEIIGKVWLLGNISVWWLTLPLIIYGIYKIFRKDKSWLIATGGYLTGYIPWLITYDRQMYFFYTAALAPFIILMIILAIRDISNVIARKYNIYNYEAYLLIGGSYCFITILFFMIYIPWYYGLPLHESQHDILTILDSWQPLEENN